MDGGGGEGEEEDYSLEGLSFEGESHSIITSGNSVDMSSMTNNVRVGVQTLDARELVCCWVSGWASHVVFCESRVPHAAVSSVCVCVLEPNQCL